MFQVVVSVDAGPNECQIYICLTRNASSCQFFSRFFSRRSDMVILTLRRSNCDRFVKIFVSKYVHTSIISLDNSESQNFTCDLQMAQDTMQHSILKSSQLEQLDYLINFAFEGVITRHMILNSDFFALATLWYFSKQHSQLHLSASELSSNLHSQPSSSKIDDVCLPHDNALSIYILIL